MARYIYTEANALIFIRYVKIDGKYIPNIEAIRDKTYKEKNNILFFMVIYLNIPINTPRKNKYIEHNINNELSQHSICIFKAIETNKTKDKAINAIINNVIFKW